jgi:hypothetical protein
MTVADYAELLVTCGLFRYPLDTETRTAESRYLELSNPGLLV